MMSERQALTLATVGLRVLKELNAPTPDTREWILELLDTPPSVEVGHYLAELEQAERVIGQKIGRPDPARWFYSTNEKRRGRKRYVKIQAG